MRNTLAVVGVNRRHSTPAEDVLGPRNILNSKINYRQEIRAVNESINYLVQQYEISYLSSSFKKGQPQGNPKTLDRYVKGDHDENDHHNIQVDHYCLQEKLRLQFKNTSSKKSKEKTGLKESICLPCYVPYLILKTISSCSSGCHILTHTETGEVATRMLRGLQYEYVTNSPLRREYVRSSNLTTISPCSSPVVIFPHILKREKLPHECSVVSNMNM
ncbi:hypothetical protein J6590_083667 [Homalodisca vitripennis]|nr:hypothetical protein J6590_083667 [Homalodisca vitripennis]